MDFKSENNIVLVVGKTEGHLEQSVFAKEILDEKKGPPPEVNLFNEKNIGLTLLKLVKEGLIESAHDVSLGGILVAISKMCLKGNKGVKFDKIKSLINKFEFYFGEDQGRYIIEISQNNEKKITTILKENSVHFDKIGIITKKDIIINSEPILTVDDLRDCNKTWLKEYMAS